MFFNYPAAFISNSVRCCCLCEDQCNIACRRRCTLLVVHGYMHIIVSVSYPVGYENEEAPYCHLMCVCVRTVR